MESIDAAQLRRDEDRAAWMTLVLLGLIAPIPTARVETIYSLATAAAERGERPDAESATVGRVVAELGEWIGQKLVLALVLQAPLAALLFAEAGNMAIEALLCHGEDGDSARAALQEADPEDRVLSRAARVRQEQQRTWPREGDDVSRRARLDETFEIYRSARENVVQSEAITYLDNTMRADRSLELGPSVLDDEPREVANAPDLPEAEPLEAANDEWLDFDTTTEPNEANEPDVDEPGPDDDLGTGTR